MAELDLPAVRAGDLICGNLPAWLAGEVCLRGGQYFALVFSAGLAERGRELSADELEARGARWARFHVQRIAAARLPQPLPETL